MDYGAIAAAGGIPKVGFSKKTCTDMRELPLGKTNRSQRIDLAPRKERSRSRCSIPGCNQALGPGRHHILQKSILVLDHEYNLIDLCQEHHNEADEFVISSADLLELKADEFKITVQEILETLTKEAGVLVYLEGEYIRAKKPVLKKVNRNEQKEAVPIKEANASRPKRPSKKKPGRKPRVKKAS